MHLYGRLKYAIKRRRTGASAALSSPFRGKNIYDVYNVYLLSATAASGWSMRATIAGWSDRGPRIDVVECCCCCIIVHLPQNSFHVCCMPLLSILWRDDVELKWSIIRLTVLDSSAIHMCIDRAWIFHETEMYLLDFIDWLHAKRRSLPF